MYDLGLDSESLPPKAIKNIWGQMWKFEYGYYIKLYCISVKLWCGHFIVLTQENILFLGDAYSSIYG